MAILINDNYSLAATKPFDARYLNITTPWASVAAANAGIPTYRYTGLTVNVAGVEYWYAEGIADIDLVVKDSGIANSGLTTANNGLTKYGTNVVLGGALTGNTTISGAHTMAFSNTTFNATATNIGLTGIVGITGAANISGAIDAESTLDILGAASLHSTLAVTGATSLTAKASYLSDLSPFTARQIPDAQWVTGQTSTAGIQTANNGLTKVGTNAVLGGALTGETTISGAHTLCLDSLSGFYVSNSDSSNMCFDGKIIGLNTSDGPFLELDGDGNTIQLKTDGGQGLNIESACVDIIAPTAIHLSGAPVTINTVAAGSSANPIMVLDSGVVKCVAASSYNVTAVNGLTATGNEVKLGGALTGNTSLTGAYDLSFSHTNINLTGAVNVVGAIDGSSTLDILGATELHSTVDITGATNLTSLNASGAIDGNSTLDILGATELHSTLDVTGVTNLTSLNASGAIDGNSTLDILGATELHSTLAVTGVTNLTAVATYGSDLSPFTARQIPDAQWVTGQTSAAGVQTVNNGLTKYGTNAVLGGSLTGATDIDINSQALTITDTGGAGIEYAANYSATFVNRSLIDKEFVDGCATAAFGCTDSCATAAFGCTDSCSTADRSYADGCDAATLTSANNYTDTCVGNCTITASNGLTKTGTDIKLGGTITGATDIDINSQALTITDTGGAGIEYSGDYSGTYVDRSLVDKAYVDSIATGLIAHEAVCVATTANNALSGLTVVDGIQLVAADRVLVKNQTTALFNGIYSASTGNWSRTSDYDFLPTGEIASGDLIPVLTGDTNINTIWILTTPNPISSGDSLTFTLFSKLLDITGGDGIDVSTTGTNREVSVDLIASQCGLCIDGAKLGFNFDVASSGLTATSGLINVNASQTAASGTEVDVRFDSSCNLVVDLDDFSNLSASNGLQMSGCYVTLGGALTGNTNLTGAYDLSFSHTNIGLTGIVGITGAANISGAIDAESTLDILGATTLHNTLDVTGATNLTSLNASGAIDAESTLDILGATELHSTLDVTGATSLGAKATYGSDLSPFTARQIPDAQWVTGQTSTAGVQTVNNGLTKVGANAVLGGTLTGDTLIDTDDYGVVIGDSTTTATGCGAFGIGCQGLASGKFSHVEGAYSVANGEYSHAEGVFTCAIAYGSHAEGGFSHACANYSHAEGHGTKAHGEYGHAEGGGSEACGNCSHAEGNGTCAIGNSSHAEGNGTKACGISSHAEGSSTHACANYSHAEGLSTCAIAQYSHAAGYYTIASGDTMYAGGKYNLPTTGTIYEIGIGTGNTARCNIVEAYADDCLVINGTTDINGATNISGAIDAESTLDILGAASLHSTLDVTGATALGSTLTLSTVAAGSSANPIMVLDSGVVKCVAASTFDITAVNGLTATGNEVKLGGTLTGDTCVASGGYNLLIGTNDSTNTGTYSAIIGGAENEIYNDYAVIIAGGAANVARGSYSGIFAGEDNRVSGDTSVIIGGNANRIATGNSCTVIIGGNSIDVGVDALPDHAIVPSLAIWDTPSDDTDGAVLVWDSATKKVGKTTIASLGGVTGATNGLGVTDNEVCLGGTLTKDTLITTGDFGIAFSFDSNSCATGNASFVGGGYYSQASGNYSFIGGGTYGYATGSGSVIIGGDNSTAAGTRTVILGASASNISAGSSNSGIINGDSNVIASGNSCTVILGGDSITVAADALPNHAIVPSLAIWDAPSAGDSADVLLAWDSTDKKVKCVSQGSVGITTATNGVCVDGTNFVLGGALTGDTTISGAYTMAFSNTAFNATATNIGLTGAVCVTGALDTSTTAIIGGAFTLSSVAAGSVDTDEVLMIASDGVVKKVDVNTLGEDNNIYDMTIVTTDVTLTTGSSYVQLINNASSGLTITLPASPTDGQVFRVKDAAGAALTYPVTIERNGKLIDGGAIDGILNTDGGALELVYNDSLGSWFVFSFVN